MPFTAAEILSALNADPAFQSLSPAEKGAQLAALAQGAPEAAAPPAPAEAPPEAASGPVLDTGDGYAELGEFMDETLRLSVGGTHYDIPAADIETGLECQRVMSPAVSIVSGATPTQAQKDQLSDAEEADLFQRLLGGALYLKDGSPNPRYSTDTDIWGRLQREGRSWPFVQHIGTTALLWAGISRDVALAFWKSGGQAPKAPPKAPQDRKPPTSMRKRASGSASKRTPAKRTAGAKSSSSGTT